MRVQELADLIGAALEGDGTLEIDSAAPIESATSSQVAFVSNRKALKEAAASAAGCLIVPLDFDNAAGRTILRTREPRGAFAKLVARLHPKPPRPAGVHPSAVVAATAEIGAGTFIGPLCVIGERVRIGRDCILHSNVTIYDDVTVGDRSILHAGSVIGADGFGFVFENGRFEKFPQVGRVEIGSDVEIGANSCVDRAALGVTSIGDGAKLDNMVHIAHNCRIGRHVVIAAQTGMAGSCIIEDYAVIGGQVGLGEGVRIESGAVLGSGAGVLSFKVIRKGTTVWGTPARPLKQYLSTLANVGRVDDLLQRVKALEQKRK